MEVISDVAVLWQWSVAASGVISPTHYYAREGLLPPGPLRQDMFPWYRQQMLDGCLVVIASLEEFPAEAAVDSVLEGLAADPRS